MRLQVLDSHAANSRSCHCAGPSSHPLWAQQCGLHSHHLLMSGSSHVVWFRLKVLTKSQQHQQELNLGHGGGSSQKGFGLSASLSVHRLDQAEPLASGGLGK